MNYIVLPHEGDDCKCFNNSIFVSKEVKNKITVLLWTSISTPFLIKKRRTSTEFALAARVTGDILNKREFYK